MLIYILFFWFHYINYEIKSSHNTTNSQPGSFFPTSFPFKYRALPFVAFNFIASFANSLAYVASSLQIYLADFYLYESYSRNLINYCDNGSNTSIIVLSPTSA